MLPSALCHTLTLSAILSHLTTASAYSQIYSRHGGLIAPNLPIKSPLNALTLDWGLSSTNNVVPSLGKLVPVDATFFQPKVSGKGLPNNGPYTLVMVDSSVNTTTPASTLLHWLQPDLYIDPIGNSSNNLLMNRSTPLDNYLSPQPITCTQTHLYTVMLFCQPQDWTLPRQFSKFVTQEKSGQYFQTVWDQLGTTIKSGNSSATTQLLTGLLGETSTTGEPSRSGFLVTDFVTHGGLGELAAATYFTESLPGTYKPMIFKAEKCPGYASSTNSSMSAISGHPSPTMSSSAALSTDRKPHGSSNSSNSNGNSTAAFPSYTGGASRNMFAQGLSIGTVAVAGLTFGIVF